MSPDALTQLLLEYRYWILVPLALIEGPVVALVAGTLAAVGYFNIYVLCVVFFIRDLGMDLVYYATGYFGSRTAFAQRMFKKLHITPERLTRLQDLLERRPGMTMLIGKLAYAISVPFIVVAGTVHMRVRYFIFYGVLLAILQYGILLFAGYFFGASQGGSIGKIIENIQYALLVGALIIGAYYFISWRMRQKLLSDENRGASKN